MMSSLKKRYKETAGGEQQAVKDAEELSANLQNEELKATTACNCWKTKQKRLTDEVAEISATRTGSNSMFFSLPLLLHSQGKPSFTPTEKVDTLVLDGVPDPGRMENQTSSTSTALPDTRQVCDDNVSKGIEAERFEFDPWFRVSKFGSRKISVRREVISGPTHPQLVIDWLTEIEIATKKGDLDYSGFVFNKRQIEFETPDSQIANGIMKIIPTELKRKINFLEETQDKEKHQMMTGRQIMFQIFSFFSINKTQGRTMNLNVLLNVEVRNHNLKIFNQAWEEVLLALDNELDEGVLESLYEGQLRKVFTLKERFIAKTVRHCPEKKEPKNYWKLRGQVIDILERQQSLSSSQTKIAPETEQHQRIFRNE